ncbi:MAG: sigma-70 family RNA polymerase sigma factor [Ktedonobacteraceae bacterium]|nr:sigma-70 family RNA polymerase sigma factor [Ktedonobacteraceae bacterium]MBA3913032.1 sigma-70 family RNA polymerase sigma factor [Terriglobales bacterium]
MLALHMRLNAKAETETAKIARGLRERDLEVLADLVQRCHHRLVRYLLYLVGRQEHAEDLAQETWIRVLQRGTQYNGRQQFDPWLFAIARNLTIDYLRKKGKAGQAVSLPDDQDAWLLLPSSGPSPFEAAARSQDAMRLAGRLQILAPLYREALLLRFQEDMSLPEIAQVVGAPVTTVSSRIYRGLAALRSAFQESDSHEG